MANGRGGPAPREASGPADFDWPGYRTAVYAGIGLLAVMFVVAILSRDVGSPLVPLGLGIVAVIFLAVQTAWMPSLFNVVFVLALLVDGAGWAWGLFESVVPLDEISHGLTAMALTLAVGFYVYRGLLEEYPRHLAPLLVALLTLGVSIGALWEVFEWIVGIEMSVSDTISDLVADTTGALLALPLAWSALRQKDGRRNTGPDPGGRGPGVGRP